MGMLDGIQSQIDYSAAATTGEKIDLLLGAIPDPDTTSTSGSQQGILSYLDEMMPMAAAVLRVEIGALRDSLTGDSDDIANGVHTVTAGEAAAGQVDIVTGLGDIQVAQAAITVVRAGSRVTADAVITEPTPGTIRIADGSTYNTTAGDTIRWSAPSA